MTRGVRNRREMSDGGATVSRSNFVCKKDDGKIYRAIRCEWAAGQRPALRVENEMAATAAAPAGRHLYSWAMKLDSTCSRRPAFHEPGVHLRSQRLDPLGEFFGGRGQLGVLLH